QGSSIRSRVQDDGRAYLDFSKAGKSMDVSLLRTFSMYKTLGPNWVESSDGFSVRRTNRSTVVYREGDREARIEVEPGDGLAVYGQTIQGWNPPHDGEPFTAADKQRVLSRVLDALRQMGIDAISA